ncbi:efflux transporter periplasmic adaptor subunit [Scytonema hofmannii PCC 7110]|uniref:Efflux transporter periplasmic adaptor subunit n=1 Tax=Scytonema hofmannii PCC 7110 TaxID=128403 RepID=A0A139X4K7_9CYAN|nr:efflux RND transporter periplasmic adaptor subunit [Scytonema hofmannii]KYC39615.1 efflux transporter periplasmic adaptor subunit [Scytonema hofmannii PCC 7110]
MPERRSQKPNITSTPTQVGRKNILIASLLSVGLLIAGCGSLPKESAEAQSRRPGNNQRGEGAVPVDVATARTGLLRQEPEYTGTTVPFRTVSLRSRVEGQLLALNVDVGDRVNQGQAIGQVDDALLRTTQNQAEAELAALKSEVARAKAQVSNARAEVERSRAQLQQAQADSTRQQKLLKEGAIAQQAAEQASTQARTTAQVLRAAQEQVRTEQEALGAAQGRVVAQQAVLAEAKERRSYARLISPITGVVLEKITEPGNFLQAGNEVLRIGDFSRVKIEVQVSELELAKIRVGQSVKVQLDAFPDRTSVGQVTRISPAADRTARLIPVEVVIPNGEGRIGSGLLARAKFETQVQARVLIPETALQGRGGEGARGRGGEQNSSSPNPQGTIFVVTEADKKPTVTARAVTLGEKADGKVEILSGLQPGERFVARSGKPLKDGAAVRLSILSEKQQ